MKNILIIVTKGEIGGAQMSVLNLARALKKKNMPVTVGLGQGEFLTNELANSGIPVVPFRWLKRTHNPVANFMFIRELKKYLNSHPVAVVHINSSNALAGALSARLARTRPRTVFTFRGLSLLDENYRKGGLLKTVYLIYFKFFLKFVDESVFVSARNLAYAKERHIVKNGRFVPNGLDPDGLDFLPRDRARNELFSRIPGLSGSGGKTFLIGSIGRLCYAKNYEFLIRNFPAVLAVNPNTVGVIIGAGEEEGKYRDLIREFGLEKKIFLPGRIDHARKYMRAFDLFWLPSRYEGLSITLLEALFAGVPILSTRVGGSTELLADAPRELYELDDKKDLLKKIDPILTDENLRQQLSAANRRIADRYHIDRTIEGYLKVYRN